MVPPGKCDGNGGEEEEQDQDPPDSVADGEVKISVSEEPSEITLEEAKIYLSDKTSERKHKENTKFTPKNFLDLVDDCLFLCENSLHDSTWDALVMRWAFTLEESCREDGTLFTTNWEDEEIPVFFKEAITKRRLTFKVNPEPQATDVPSHEETNVTEVEVQEPGQGAGLAGKVKEQEPDHMLGPGGLLGLVEEASVRVRELLEPENRTMRQDIVKEEILQEKEKGQELKYLVDLELQDASRQQQQLHEKTPSITKRGKRSPEAVLRRYQRWRSGETGRWTDQGSGGGRRQSRYTTHKLLPKPQKLVFSTETPPQKQERRQNKQLLSDWRQEEMECRSERQGGQEKQEPWSQLGQEQKRLERETQEEVFRQQWKLEEDRLLNTRFHIWLRDQIKGEVEDVLRLRETHSLRLEGRVLGGEEDRIGECVRQVQHHSLGGHEVAPTLNSGTQPVSASSHQTNSMLRQEGDLMVGGGVTAEVPRLVEVWGGCGAEGRQRAFCWNCREWGSLVRFS